MGTTKTSSTKKKPLGFLKTLKLYFSSLTARGAKYLFLNVGNLENSIVITNGDYEMLTAYVPVSLTVHVVTFKDPEFYEELMKFLRFETKKPFVIRMNLFLKALKDADIDNMTVIYDDDGHMKITAADQLISDDDILDDDSDMDDEEDDEYDPEENPFVDTSKWVTTTFDSLDICGQPVENFHALSVLESTIVNMLGYEVSVPKADRPYTEITIPRDFSYFNSNYFRIYIPLTEFRMPDGEPFYSEDMWDFHIILIDGFDVPSMREFVKKRDTDVSLLLWANSGGTIQHMAKYDDAEISIRSMRPFAESLPIRKSQIRRSTNASGT